MTAFLREVRRRQDLRYAAFVAAVCLSFVAAVALYVLNRGSP